MSVTAAATASLWNSKKQRKDSKESRSRPIAIGLPGLFLGDSRKKPQSMRQSVTRHTSVGKHRRMPLTAPEKACTVRKRILLSPEGAGQQNTAPPHAIRLQLSVHISAVFSMTSGRSARQCRIIIHSCRLDVKNSTRARSGEFCTCSASRKVAESSVSFVDFMTSFLNVFKERLRKFRHYRKEIIAKEPVLSDRLRQILRQREHASAASSCAQGNYFIQGSIL